MLAITILSWTQPCQRGMVVCAWASAGVCCTPPYFNLYLLCRLLEVNGLDVTSLTPRAVSDLLQQRPGLVQMVVSRLIPLGGGSDLRSGSEGDIRSSYDELQRDKESLTFQLSQQNSAANNWRELHDK